MKPPTPSPRPTKALHLTLTFQSPGEHATGSVTIRWEAAVIGVRSSKFTPPYTSDTLTLVMRALDQIQISYQVVEQFSPPEQARLADLGLWQTSGGLRPDGHRVVGQALYEALTADPAGDEALQAVRDAATAQGVALALHLRLPTQAVELAALPWELLWEPIDGATPLLLSYGRAAECTRYLDLAQALPRLQQHTGPLRVLVLVPHAGLTEEQRTAEQQARERVWQPLLRSGRLEMDYLSPVTREGLVDWLHSWPRPQIVHYYGHGRFENGSGQLLLDGEEGGDAWTDTHVLTPLFGGVQMMALFACQGAMLQHPGSMLTSIAPALSAAGVPVVLGMQVSVRARAATRASDVLYRALAAGWSVQRSVALMRQALYVEEQDQASWYVPVVYVRTERPQPVYLVQSPVSAPHQTTDLTSATNTPRPSFQQRVQSRRASQIDGVAATAIGATQQHIRATETGQVEQIEITGDGAGHQEVSADEGSVVRNVSLKGTSE